MRQRGRKSFASLAILPIGEVPRPSAPRRLTAEERRVWRDVVHRFRPDHFVGCEPVLECYCEAVGLGRWLTEQIKASDPGDHKRLAVLVRLQKTQAMLIGNLAGKLRISPQSRWDRYSARLRPSPTLPKPWELGRNSRPLDDEPDGGGSPFDAA
jgi:hypothetical protein